MGSPTLLELIRQRFPDLSEKELYARILCGEVRVNGERIRQPQKKCRPDDRVEWRQEKTFVSRGGEKLFGALSAFSLACAGKIFLDCGASSGGFTDCLLQRGATRVFAVDVGYAQFDFKLRYDPRVTLWERTNIMSLSAHSFDTAPHAAVIDLSFRSLRKAARHVLRLVSERWAVALVKPQFEWGRPPAGYDGVVRDPADRRDIIWSLVMDLREEGVALKRAAVSPLKGARGNEEYFFLLTIESGIPGEPERKLVESLFT